MVILKRSDEKDYHHIGIRFCMVVVYQKPNLLWSLYNLKYHFGASSYPIRR